MLMISFLDLLMNCFVRILNHAWIKSSKCLWWESSTTFLDSKSSKGVIKFSHQGKYTRELIKKFGLEDAKISKTPMPPQQSLIRMDKIKTLILNSIEAWLIVCFTWWLVGRILCLVLIYVLDSNIVLKSPIW